MTTRRLTEDEWLAAERPGPLLNRFRNKGRERQLRLFAAACLGRLGGLLTGELRQGREAAEQYAEGRLSRSELKKVRQAVSLLGGGAGRGADAARAVAAALDSAELYWQPARSTAEFAARAISAGEKARLAEECRAQAELVREVFGNPFRPLVIDPGWLTPEVAGLARHIYEARDFAAMPALAEALKRAGCAHAALLGHCRAGTGHVPGCHVLDALLGKR